MVEINRVFVRGDCHGDFDWLEEWCEENETTTNDILILLGDSALRFEGNSSAKEEARKIRVSHCPVTIFAVRGNHDRPFIDPFKEEVELVECQYLDHNHNDNILMWHDNRYNNIWYFNEDNPIYYIKNKSFCILPGAYSVDKEWRQLMHWPWYEDEQLSYHQRLDYLDRIYDRSFDFVLSHTCPYEWRPTDLFLSSIDQSKVDNSTEYWLSDVKKYIGYKYWYFGHYHANRDYGKVSEYDWNGETIMLFDEVRRIL